MKIKMKCEEQVRVLTKSANEWHMNDRSGISYKLGIRSGDDIDKIKVTKELHDLLDIDKDYLLLGTLTISNGNTSFLFDSVQLDASAGKTPSPDVGNGSGKPTR